MRTVAVGEAVSEIVAIAGRAGENRVTIDSQTVPEVRLNGEPVELDPGQSELRSGVCLSALPSGGFAATFGNGLQIGLQGRVMKFASAPTATTGLLGNSNGRMGDDAIDQSGNLIGDGRYPEGDELYKLVGDAWRVRAETTLFDYRTGEGPGSFNSPDFPPDLLGRATIDEVALSAARALCAAIADDDFRTACEFDVSQTGDASYAKEALGLAGGAGAIDEVVAVFQLNIGDEIGPHLPGGVGKIEPGQMDVFTVKPEPGGELRLKFVEPCAPDSTRLFIVDPNGAVLRNLFVDNCRIVDGIDGEHDQLDFYILLDAGSAGGEYAFRLVLQPDFT